MLAELRQRFPFTLFAYCLMDNHFHFLIRVLQIPLAELMRALLSRYALYFNSRHGTTGHLFQGRYTAIVCAGDSYFLELLRYIHLNPVRAGLVRQPEDWPWSSHVSYLSGEAESLAEPEFPLSLFDADRSIARSAYRDFVQGGSSPLERQPAAQEILAPPVQADYSDSVPAILTRKSLDEIAEEISLENGLDVGVIKNTASRLRSIARARHEFIRGAAAAGFRTGEIATYLASSPALVSKVIRAEFVKSLTSDP